MDAINRYSPDRLPCHSAFLNAALDDDFPKEFCGIEYASAFELYKNVTAFHFTSGGKPWSRRMPETASVPHRHLWEEWSRLDANDNVLTI